MRQQLQRDIAIIVATAHCWADTDIEIAARITRRVDEYTRQLQAEIDSATRLIARLQMAREVTAA